MQEIVQDLRYGFRMLLKTPGSTVAAILALTLGIGVNSAIFTIIDTVLIRPLPYPDPDHIMLVFENKPDKGLRRELVSPRDFESYQKGNAVFDLIGVVRDQPFVLAGRDLPERVDGAVISPSVFRILGMRPKLGRPFAPEESEPQNNARVVISDGLWRRRFAADPNVLGSALVLDNRRYTVVGIAPPGFRLAGSLSELWIPYTPDPNELTPSQGGLHTLEVLAHLKPGVTARQAGTEMQRIARQLAEANPNTNAGYGGEVVPLQEHLVGNIGATLWTLTGAVVFVLLIACANVANLLLARAGAREKEIAVRTSLGANPARIVRQMLTESILLALIGGILGLSLAYGATEAIVKLAPANIPRLQEVSLDWRVVAFTFLISVGTGVLFGLAPALASVKPDLNAVLRGTGRGNTASSSRSRLRDMLVVWEIACCVVLLTTAGLLLRSFARLESVNPGFRPDHVLTMQLSLPPTQYSGLRISQFYRQMLERVRMLPGVQSAGVCRILPLTGSDLSLNFRIEGQATQAVADQPRAKFRAASPGYFQALGIPLIRGRLLDPTDSADTPKVVVINQAAARRYWPGEDPIGKHILSGNDENRWSTVVGIIGDVKYAGLDSASSPETYYHFLQVPPDVLSIAEGTMYLVIRTNIDPASMTAAVRSELRGLDPNQPVFNVQTMNERLETSIAQPRFRMMLLGAFAGLALVLAAIGVYGVMAYSVSQRTNEMGVRMALGASASDIGQLVVGHGLRMALLGIAIGVILAGATTWTISRLLFGVAPVDLPSYAAACLLTLVVALLASCIPALRAIRVAPAIALRAE